MTVTYRGSLTVAGAIPGLSIALGTVGQSLTNLQAVASAQFAALLAASATINAQVSAVLTAKAAIRIPATADIQAQLDASIAIGAQLTADVGNPSVYLAGLLEGLVQVEASIGSLAPSVALSAQIDASASVSADMSAKLAAVDLQLAALADVAVAISAAAGALAAIQAALSVAVSAVVGAISVYAQFVGVFGAAGVHGFLYSGTVASIGTELDAAIAADTGFAGGLVVHLPFFVYDAANAGAVSGMRLVISQGGA